MMWTLHGNPAAILIVFNHAFCIYGLLFMLQLKLYLRWDRSKSLAPSSATQFLPWSNGLPVAAGKFIHNICMMADQCSSDNELLNSLDLIINEIRVLCVYQRWIQWTLTLNADDVVVIVGPIAHMNIERTHRMQTPIHKCRMSMRISVISANIQSKWIKPMSSKWLVPITAVSTYGRHSNRFKNRINAPIDGMGMGMGIGIGWWRHQFWRRTSRRWVEVER